MAQAAHVLHQGIHAGPDGQHGIQRGAGQRIALLAPVVLGGFGLALLLVGLQGFVEQAAAVEGMLAQHALAPGVDGVDGRVVHAFGGHGQAPGGLLACRAFGVGLQQGLQQAVVCGHRPLATEAGHGFDQAGADAVGQLARGCAREGHDQDVGRHQGPPEGLRAAVPQHQAQVEGGDRPGLAGAGAGLDQAAAVQGKVGGVEYMAHVSCPGCCAPSTLRETGAPATVRRPRSRPCQRAPWNGLCPATGVAPFAQQKGELRSSMGVVSFQSSRALRAIRTQSPHQRSSGPWIRGAHCRSRPSASSAPKSGYRRAQ